MSGWLWCVGAFGRCFDCGHLCQGLWRFLATESVSTMSVCAECAGKEI